MIDSPGNGTGNIKGNERNKVMSAWPRVRSARINLEKVTLSVSQMTAKRASSADSFCLGRVFAEEDFWLT